MNPLTELPALYRKYLYVAYGFAALILGAVTAYYAVDPSATLPGWLEGAGRIIAFLAIPFSALASSNVTPDSEPKPAPDHNGLI